ncbi:CpaF family protein [Sulfitobacter pacificus]|uniref:CpaF family protein n=1 Tax=Sulfitobacter pacificus TaxID=1499314 RepID=UPI003619EF38
MANDVVHALLEFLDFSELAAKPRAEQEILIRSGIETVSTDRKLHLNGREIAELVAAVLADMLGLGPLESLLADDRVTDIMVNGPDQIFVERGGKLELTQVRFRDNEHVFTVASRIVAAVGRRIDESQPMVDARLADGSRVNIAVPPLAIDGPTITIRKFPSSPVKLEKLVEGGSLTAQMSRFLALAAYMRLNILVSGGTGSGKTTLMNAMSGFIPEGERIVTIEDAAELRFQQEHVVRFETRPPNVEGTGEVTMRTLVRNALRMRPDRIIIGEVRGDEVLDLLQAMNTGHDGSMSTLHANSPAEALTRVESMAALAGFAPGGGVVRRQLVDAVHLIVQVSRMRDGKRRVTSISELTGLSGDVITLQELFSFQTDPESTRTKVTGKHVYSGYRPGFSSRAADYGVAEELDSILGVK